MHKTNNSTNQNNECCNNCGSDIYYIERVEPHLCKGLAKDEPDIIIYEYYKEPVCTNCDEMTEVITKAEFDNRVNALYSKVYNDVDLENDLIDLFSENAKTLLN